VLVRGFVTVIAEDDAIVGGSDPSMIGLQRVPRLIWDHMVSMFDHVIQDGPAVRTAPLLTKICSVLNRFTEVEGSSHEIHSTSTRLHSDICMVDNTDNNLTFLL
jgi:hypothetical protein